jgi:CDP-glucose 4,6-dehydratase
MNVDFWRGRRVLITGQTGFKGGWLSLYLHRLGARVHGYGLAPEPGPNLYDKARLGEVIDSEFGDIRDATALRDCLERANPEVVFHLAAQALVRRSYADPVETYSTNVMGTVNLLQAVRSAQRVRAVVVVTSDKCYENDESGGAFSETSPLGGHDPYSSSKACAELVCSAWRRSFLAQSDSAQIGLVTARAGNVIGGGDWSADRLVPDLVAGFLAKTAVSIRNPMSIRPWQHVLEPITGYVTLAERAFNQPAKYSGAWNFGPDQADVRPVAAIARDLMRLMGGESLLAAGMPSPVFHEAARLVLNSDKARRELGWVPRWTCERALAAVAHWYAEEDRGASARQLTLDQIALYAGDTGARASRLARRQQQRVGPQGHRSVEHELDMGN